MERGTEMSITYTEITLENMEDRIMAKLGYIKPSEARQLTVRAMVDTGSTDLVISEATRQRLGLEIVRSERLELADNRYEVFPVTESVRICWKDRDTSLAAVVVPGDGETLLGALPMEAMDLTVNPLRQEVVGAHGDRPLHMAK
jgi:clan AA aspartic protease